MRALVTGATGFVGSAVARALTVAGWQVRALVRAGSDRRNLRELPVEIASGDLTERASLDGALDGCEALFHVAADYRLWTPDPQLLYRTNVEGTRNVIEAARRAKVARIVYTSSVATVGLPADGSPGSEETPVALADMIGHYKRSKFLAEELVRGEARTGAPVVIVNPSTPVGPGDLKPTPTGRLGGENLTLREILVRITRLAGRSPPRIRLPHWGVLPLAYLSEGLSRLTHRGTRLTVESVRMARHRMYFSSDKAVRELGYQWRSPEAAFEDAVRWYQGQGML